MRLAALIPLVLACCGATCSTKPTPLPTVPEIVRVAVPTPVALPEELTRDCDDVAKQSNTYGEAVRLANARKAATDECTGRMRQIRSLQPARAATPAQDGSR